MIEIKTISTSGYHNLSRGEFILMESKAHLVTKVLSAYQFEYRLCKWYDLVLVTYWRGCDWFKRRIL